MKDKEERLVEERDKIFKSQIKTTSQGSKAGGQIIIRTFFYLCSCDCLLDFDYGRQFFEVKGVCGFGAMKHDSH